MCSYVALVRAAARRALLFHTVENIPQPKVKWCWSAIQDVPHIAKREQF